MHTLIHDRDLIVREVDQLQSAHLGWEHGWLHYGEAILIRKESEKLHVVAEKIVGD